MPSAWGTSEECSTETLKPIKLSAGKRQSAVPSAWLTAGSKEKQRVTAAGTRLITDMSADVAGSGLCPVTKQPMVRMFANGHPCLVSMDAMVCLPTKD
ncbi:hypothetical protein [Achromobacter phage Motura]|uniref:Uncharacterized protein n=1 Tax=Achromobacter phage Motura TaxID=2591403 RepID=A0A514CT28_9CAUD|nr:hypothetical protein H1O15_gp149 [Achromobacter phage Motura]QDH83639.1 hypothetical protein [Achromobacter phage Motura]